jgi:hypothetical protein
MILKSFQIAEEGATFRAFFHGIGAFRDFDDTKR